MNKILSVIIILAFIISTITAAIIMPTTITTAVIKQILLHQRPLKLHKTHRKFKRKKSTLKK
mgnify:CR=1 FL=1